MATKQRRICKAGHTDKSKSRKTRRPAANGEAYLREILGWISTQTNDFKIIRL